MTARLFLQVFSIQARKLMSYRADFWLNAVVLFFVEFGIAYFLWSAIFRASDATEIAGMTLQTMLLYYVSVLLLGKVVKGTERDITVSTEIYEGTLTRYLLYPSNYFGIKYAEHLGLMAPALVELVLFGLAAVLLIQPSGSVHVTPRTVAMAAVAVLLANLLQFALLFPIQAVGFWADNVWTLLVMYRFASQMLGGLFLPLNLFPDWSQPLLAALPFKYLFYFPATTLLGQVDDASWLRGIAVTAAWCVIAGLVGRWVWRRGTHQYTGVGI